MQQKGLKNILLPIRLYAKIIMIAKLPIYSNRENFQKKINMVYHTVKKAYKKKIPLQLGFFV